jgi:hypothetical protein
VDPAIGNAVVPNRPLENHYRFPSLVQIPVTYKAYKGGYIDPSPWPDSLIGDTESWSTIAEQGPSRQCLFDDIRSFYASNTFSRGHVPSHSEFLHPSDLIKRIAYANWINLLEYVQDNTSSLEYQHESLQWLQSDARNTGAMSKAYSFRSLQWLKSNLHVSYGWKRRCDHYCDWLETNLVELNVTGLGTGFGGCSPPRETQDWLLILKHLRMWRDRTRDINSAVLNHLSVMESGQSLDEARSARLLAVLGSIFLPLSLVSSIFSMGENFLPGRQDFWVYFAVSVPLVVAALGFAFGSGRVVEKVKVWRSLRKEARETELVTDAHPVSRRISEGHDIVL